MPEPDYDAWLDRQDPAQSDPLCPLCGDVTDAEDIDDREESLFCSACIEMAAAELEEDDDAPPLNHAVTDYAGRERECIVDWLATGTTGTI